MKKQNIQGLKCDPSHFDSVVNLLAPNSASTETPFRQIVAALATGRGLMVIILAPIILNSSGSSRRNIEAEVLTVFIFHISLILD